MRQWEKCSAFCTLPHVDYFRLGERSSHFRGHLWQAIILIWEFIQAFPAHRLSSRSQPQITLSFYSSASSQLLPSPGNTLPFTSSWKAFPQFEGTLGSTALLGKLSRHFISSHANLFDSLPPPVGGLWEVAPRPMASAMPGTLHIAHDEDALMNLKSR